jgi:triacylglycerol lipase
MLRSLRQHVYMSPGMFGFGRLGSYNYFTHVERELVARFAAAGHELAVHVIEDLPTASIRRRAIRLAEMVARTSGSEPIHLFGHSTGGLDARLVASPATRMPIDPKLLAWLPRLRSVTTMNTPHHGTPLASFFVTAMGQRVLSALSALTVTGLSLGAQPLAAASVVLGVLSASDQRLPFQRSLLDRSITSVVGLVDDARSPEVKTFLGAIEEDQGSMLQVSPEAMDLVVAGFADRPGVTYQSTISMSPTPKPRRWIEQIGHPWRAVSLSLFYALHRITGKVNKRYPCAAMRDTVPFAGQAIEAMLARVFGTAPLEANDGIVPLRSQVWGNVVWAGYGDHLDVLGHYVDKRGDDVAPPLRHRDWLTSGSDFGDREFSALMDAIANGMLTTSSDSRPDPNS